MKLRVLIALFVVAIAAIFVQTASAKSSHGNRTLPHRSFKSMTLDQVVAYQRRSLSHHQHIVRSFLEWRRHHSKLAALYEETDLPTCKALGIVAPRDVCWAASAERWTRRELKENLARKAKRDAARAAAARHASLGDVQAWTCIHGYEGAWNAETGNGYHGGLQMDSGFENTYGAEFVARWGHAGNWPIWAQLTAAQRAHDGYNGYSARGYGPWPNTAHSCGLI